MFSDACESFIQTVDLSTHIQSLLSVQHLIAGDAAAFILRLAGHIAGIIGPMPVSNGQFAAALDELFGSVVEAEVLWSQARVRVAWIIGLQKVLGDGHANNRSWLSDHGEHSFNADLHCSLPFVMGGLVV